MYKFRFIKAESEGSIIHLFGRRNNQKYHLVIFDFEPYFYTLYPEAFEGLKEVKRGEKEPYKTLFGETVYKVVVFHPGQVPKIRDIAPTFEADVPYVHRFLIDKGITQYFYVTDRRFSDIPNVPLRVSHRFIQGDFFDKIKGII